MADMDRVTHDHEDHIRDSAPAPPVSTCTGSTPGQQPENWLPHLAEESHIQIPEDLHSRETTKSLLEQLQLLSGTFR